MKHYYFEQTGKIIQAEFWGNMVTITRCRANGQKMVNSQPETFDRNMWLFVKRYERFKPATKHVLTVQAVEKCVQTAEKLAQTARENFKPEPLPEINWLELLGA